MFNGGPMDRRTDGQTDGQTDRHSDSGWQIADSGRQTDGWTDGPTDQRTNGQTDRWTDGQMMDGGRQTNGQQTVHQFLG
jgi:hypothetical protein